MRHISATVIAALLATSTGNGARAADPSPSSPLGTVLVKVNECTAGWIYAASPAGETMTLDLQPSVTPSDQVGLIVSASATAASVSGTKSGGNWFLDVTVPSTYLAGLTSSFSKKQLTYIEVAFTETVPGPGLVLKNFSIRDTGRVC